MILFADREGPDETADVQADLGLHSLHMPGDTFLHDTALVKTCPSVSDTSRQRRPYQTEHSAT